MVEKSFGTILLSHEEEACLMGKDLLRRISFLRLFQHSANEERKAPPGEHAARLLRNLPTLFCPFSHTLEVPGSLP